MIVWMYAGQGSQYAGMGKDLYERFPAYRNVADRAAEYLKQTKAFAASDRTEKSGAEAAAPLDARLLMHEGPAELLSETAFTQPCMAVFAAGVTEVLKENGCRPDAACGLSLGEYGALYAAGVWNAETYVKLTAFRGEKMAEAVREMQYSMSAVLVAKNEEVEQICREISEADDAEPAAFVTPVNYNCPGQIVICGDPDSVSKAEERLRESCRARTRRLNTTSPFHTKLLKEAGDALRERISALKDENGVSSPAVPVAMNATGTFWESGEDLAELLARQVQSPVRFEEDLRCLIQAGADTFVEIGPGKVLSGLCRKTAAALGKKVNCFPVENAADLENVLERCKTGME